MQGIRVITKHSDSVLISGRALTVAVNMLNGKDYRRLSASVIKELEANGMAIQVEHVRGEGTWYYPLHRKQFASRLNEIKPTHSTTP